MIAVAENRDAAASPVRNPRPELTTPSPRFTIDGDDALERHLETTCVRVLSGIRGLIPERKLEALLLGGGYGRGEGGVLRGEGGDRPYNDLEFYVAIAGNRHVNEFVYQRRLHVLGEILTHLAGVEVEFKITSLGELARRPISMFSYDLIVGHRQLWAAPAARVLELASCDHHRRAEKIPLPEATRLLMNRCSGLLFARARLEKKPLAPGPADFVRRNIAKAQLALGDAVLTAHGRYHWSARERHLRLSQLAWPESPQWFADVLRHHAAGVEFKFHPATGIVSPETLAARHAEVTALALECWLWLESRRLGRSFATARDYALDAADKCPDGSWPRNAALNLRADEFRLRLQSRSWQHPRQRVFRALSLLLWEPTAFSDDRLRVQLEGDLNSPMTKFDEAVAAYEKLWSRVR